MSKLELLKLLAQEKLERLRKQSAPKLRKSKISGNESDFQTVNSRKSIHASDSKSSLEVAEQERKAQPLAA